MRIDKAKKQFNPLKSESVIYDEIINMQKRKNKNGIKAHSKRLSHIEGTPDYVRMYRWYEGDRILSLKSQPFSDLKSAQHFSDCFNDSFLYDSYCEEEDGLYYVYSGWLIKYSFTSYSIRSKGEYFEFANWS